MSGCFGNFSSKLSLLILQVTIYGICVAYLERAYSLWTQFFSRSLAIAKGINRPYFSVKNMTNQR